MLLASAEDQRDVFKRAWKHVMLRETAEGQCHIFKRGGHRFSTYKTVEHL
jgi:hypothetical protein